jgi:hypothetical protein
VLLIDSPEEGKSDNATPLQALHMGHCREGEHMILDLEEAVFVLEMPCGVMLGF